jgi:hypothetical protein
MEVAVTPGISQVPIFEMPTGAVSVRVRARPPIDCTMYQLRLLWEGEFADALAPSLDGKDCVGRMVMPAGVPFTLEIGRMGPIVHREPIQSDARTPNDKIVTLPP